MKVYRTYWITRHYSGFAKRQEVSYLAYRRTTYVDLRPDEVEELLRHLSQYYNRVSVSKDGTRVYWVKRIRRIVRKEFFDNGEVSRQVFLPRRLGEKMRPLLIERLGDECDRHAGLHSVRVRRVL